MAVINPFLNIKTDDSGITTSLSPSEQTAALSSLGVSSSSPRIRNQPVQKTVLQNVNDTAAKTRQRFIEEEQRQQKLKEQRIQLDKTIEQRKLDLEASREFAQQKAKQQYENLKKQGLIKGTFQSYLQSKTILRVEAEPKIDSKGVSQRETFFKKQPKSIDENFKANLKAPINFKSEAEPKVRLIKDNITNLFRPIVVREINSSPLKNKFESDLITGDIFIKPKEFNLVLDISDIEKKTKEFSFFDVDFNKLSRDISATRTNLKEAKIKSLIGDFKVPEQLQAIPFIGGIFIPENERQAAQKQVDISRQYADLLKNNNKGQGTEIKINYLDDAIKEQQKTEQELKKIRNRDRIREVSEIVLLAPLGGVTSKLFTGIKFNLPTQAVLSGLFVSGITSQADKFYNEIKDAKQPYEVVRGIEKLSVLGAGVLSFGAGIKIQQSGVIRGKIQEIKFKNLVKSYQDSNIKFNPKNKFIDVNPEGEILTGQTQLKSKSFDPLKRFEKPFLSSDKIDTRINTKITDFYGNKNLIVVGGKNDPTTLLTEKFFVQPAKIKNIVSIEQVIKSSQTKLFFFGDEFILTQQTGKPPQFGFGSEITTRKMFFGKKGQLSLSSQILEQPQQIGDFEIPFSDVTTQRTSIPRFSAKINPITQPGTENIFNAVVFPAFGIGVDLKEKEISKQINPLSKLKLSLKPKIESQFNTNYNKLVENNIKNNEIGSIKITKLDKTQIFKPSVKYGLATTFKPIFKPVLEKPLDFDFTPDIKPPKIKPPEKIPTFSIPDKPQPPQFNPPPFIPFKLGTQTKPRQSFFNDFQKGFNVFVRREGKFKQVNLKPLSKREALNLGAFKVDTSAAATFKLSEAKQSAFKSNKRLFDDFKFNKQFRTKKDDDDLLYIERRKFRMSTGGEKNEIKPKRFF